MNTNVTDGDLDPYDLYENEQYDPLKKRDREQGFNDPFWSFSEQTIDDWAALACPSSH